ncbi:MAG: VCBS repeat-containing protein [bacterium]|nr:VCBS repeat-containing protein [bacterium]
MKNLTSIAIALVTLTPSALALSSPAGFGGNELRFKRWGTVSPAPGWDVQMGRFVDIPGTGHESDVVAYHADSGTLWVGAEPPGQQLQFSHWGTVSPPGDWTFVVGDVDGNGFSDVIGYHPSNGTVWVGLNTGASFDFQLFGAVGPAAGWTFVAGDVNGDGLCDVVGYYAGNGTLWAGVNNGSMFLFDQWGAVSPAAGWRFTAGDFSGDGVCDLVGHHPSNGSLWSANSTGTSFHFAQVGSVPAGDNWSVVSVYAYQPFLALLAYDSATGALRLGERDNAVGAFTFSPAGRLYPSTGWTLRTGTLFAGGSNPWSRILAYHPSNGSLWRTNFVWVE